MIPYMNTTTHGCDDEGPCKICTVLSGTRFLMLGPEAPHVVVCSGRSGKTKCPVHPSINLYLTMCGWGNVFAKCNWSKIKKI